jgi:hypothetical protein
MPPAVQKSVGYGFQATLLRMRHQKVLKTDSQPWIDIDALQVNVYSCFQTKNFVGPKYRMLLRRQFSDIKDFY